MVKGRNSLRRHRCRRIRAKVKGTGERPRLSVFRSLKSIYVQVIDDLSGKTLAAANLKEIKKVRNDVKGAEALGRLLAEKCLRAGIKKVVFDRGGYKYHSKIRALAEGAKKTGLEF